MLPLGKEKKEGLVWCNTRKKEKKLWVVKNLCKTCEKPVENLWKTCGKLPPSPFTLFSPPLKRNLNLLLPPQFFFFFLRKNYKKTEKLKNKRKCP